MLVEALTYLLTPCSRPARRRGYLSQAIALEARWKRCHRAWQPHVEECRTVVRAAMARCGSHQRVTVLGSGLGLEIPLDDLAATFGEVVLVDMVHLPSLRRRVRRFANVRLIERDVTGAVADLDADLVVSANLLSQLPLLPLDRLAAATAPANRAAFARHLIENHLNWLCRLGTVACLVTDVDRRTCDGDRVLDRQDALFGADLPEADREWLWTIAPRPEVERHTDQVRRVVGVFDLNAGRGRQILSGTRQESPGVPATPAGP